MLKLSEKPIERNRCDCGLSQEFLDVILKACSLKEEKLINWLSQN